MRRDSGVHGGSRLSLGLGYLACNDAEDSTARKQCADTNTPLIMSVRIHHRHMYIKPHPFKHIGSPSTMHIEKKEMRNRAIHYLLYCELFMYDVVDALNYIGRK